MRSSLNANAAPSASVANQVSNQRCVTEMVEVLPGRLYWRGQPKQDYSTLFWNEYSYHHPQGNYNFKLFPNAQPTASGGNKNNDPNMTYGTTEYDSLLYQSTSYRFETDLDICYQSFASDYGPLNLAVIWRYCRLLEQVLAMEVRTPPENNSNGNNNNMNVDDTPKQLKVIHQSNSSEILRKTNSVFLICAYCIVKEGLTAQQAFAPFQKIMNNSNPKQRSIESTLLPYRDASSCAVSLFNEISVLTCLEALEAGMKLGWFDYATFDPDFYEHFEKVENGDLNWIIPSSSSSSSSAKGKNSNANGSFQNQNCTKIMAFATPTNVSKDLDGYSSWSPEMYTPLFKQWNIGTVIRLNKHTCYDRQKFIKGGIKHSDLYFSDGGLPPPEHVHEFLRLVEGEPGGVAVHCKAGLGRTGTLIGAYVMKHYKMPARLFIAWNRLARPGSILGPQQRYLCDIEAQMFSMPSSMQYILSVRTGQNSNAQYVNPGGQSIHGSDNIRMIVNPKFYGNNGNNNNTNLSASINNSVNKPMYGTAANGDSNNQINHSGHSTIQQEGQGEWLLHQKNRRQHHKTSYSGPQPKNYTVL